MNYRYTPSQAKVLAKLEAGYKVYAGASRVAAIHPVTGATCYFKYRTLKSLVLRGILSESGGCYFKVIG